MQNTHTPKTYRAKKSLGQNFLKSAPALRKIIEAGEVVKDDTVLEIGPGKGALTAKLLAHAGRVIAVEKDRELLEPLKEKFAQEIADKKLILIHEDILRFKVESHKVKSYKVIANIPYNITGAILKHFLTARHQPERMILMVQHEVAKRIVDAKGSILSISVKAYGTPKLVMKVPARYFSPAPKVDSAVIAITGISRQIFNSPLEEYPLGGGGHTSTPSRTRATPQEGNFDAGGGGRILHPGASATPQEGNFDAEENFWRIVRAGFAHKRKKLAGNLKGTISAEKLTEKLQKLSLQNARAEDLTLSDWIELAK